MMNLNGKFKFPLFGWVVYLLLMVLLCSLGFWQVKRAEQKTLFLQQQQLAIDAPLLNLNLQPILDGANLDAVRYQKVVVAGRYDEAHQFLIDNQIMDGKPGYFVLTPFLIDQEKRAILVNRGWVPLGRDRNSLPNVALKTTVLQVNGRINFFPSVGIKLKDAEIPSDGWPSVVQVVNHDVLASRLGYDLYSFQIELDPKASEGYRRNWQVSPILSPEKHLAYAVQWFGLALTLTALFFWINNRKQSEDSEE
ncbi:MAG: SURF1 family protein [Methylococcales bacterium]|nr:SURF1 family protein [Methylococcales bacterium]